MKFKIIHQTEYTFDSEVFLEPHLMRFRVRPMSYLDLHDFSIGISPISVGHKVTQDEENNVLDYYWFHDLTNQLTIKTESIISTKPFNPFDFIVYPIEFNQLPFVYTKTQTRLLTAALDAQPISKDLTAYGNAILKQSDFNTIPYLINLTREIHTDFTVEYREDGAPLPPDETYGLKKGSCRDLSWMQIHLLRQQGIAARFVSGYYYFDMDTPAYELHAWVDVFLPGAGWIGIDPSHGILTGNTHFPIASSAFHDNTMPVSGTIRGDATSKLTTQLSIEKL